FNYRLTDIAAALGTSQLRKLEQNVQRRRAIAAEYSSAFAGLALKLPVVREDVSPAWHLYPIRLCPEFLSAKRRDIFGALRSENIGVNVHYIPVHLHPYYQDRFGFRTGEFPVTETAYQQLISLQMFHGMSDADVQDVIDAVRKVMTAYMQ